MIEGLLISDLDVAYIIGICYIYVGNNIIVPLDWYIYIITKLDAIFFKEAKLNSNKVSKYTEAFKTTNSPT